MARGWSRIYTHQKARLDIRELQGGRSGRKNLLQAGAKIHSHWLNTGHSVRIHVRTDHVDIEYQVESGGRSFSQSISVQLSFTQCKLGGSRAWWECPSCSKRVAVLYGWGRFQCRKCLDLHYLSQSETDQDRTLRRAGKLRKRLGWQPGIINPRGGKPRGMHWQTYYQLSARCHFEEMKGLASLGASIPNLIGGGMRVSDVSSRQVRPKSNDRPVKLQERPKASNSPAGLQPVVLIGSHSAVATVRNAPDTVQCRDCTNLSAGFRCLSPGSGQTAPLLGEWRECSYFLPI